jgi:hypothetical protein
MTFAKENFLNLSKTGAFVNFFQKGPKRKKKSRDMPVVAAFLFSSKNFTNYPSHQSYGAN